MLKAVLFDLDGTMLDSNQSIRATINAVLAERRHPTFSKPELDALIGHPLRAILAAKAPTASPADIEAMALRYRDLYTESGWFTVSLAPGIQDLITDLRRGGLRIGIVTSKGQHETEALMADLGVLALFDAIVGDDDVRPLKPDAAPFLAACRKLGCDADEAVIIGDTRFDVSCGKSAGGHTIGVLWGNGSRQSLVEAGADTLVGSVPELRSALRRLAKAAAV